MTVGDVGCWQVFTPISLAYVEGSSCFSRGKTGLVFVLIVKLLYQASSSSGVFSLLHRKGIIQVALLSASYHTESGRRLFIWLLLL